MELARNLFIYDADLLPETVQEEFLELINDPPAKDVFKEKKIEEFWCDVVI